MRPSAVRRLLVVAGAFAAVLLLAAPVAVAQIRPAVVKNVDEPGRVPYVQFFSAVPGLSTGCGVNFCDFYLPAVPAGKRLVITDVYGVINLEPGATVHSLQLRATDSSFVTTRNIFEVPHNPSAYYTVALAYELRRYAFQAKVTMFVEAGDRVAVHFWTGGSLHEDYATSLTIVGYLVDVTI